MQLIFFLCFSYINLFPDRRIKQDSSQFCMSTEGTSSESKVFHIFKSCYHMVGRSSEVSLSRFNDIKMENVKYNRGFYNVEMQGIDRSKTSTYQEICIYPNREFIPYDWYWSMSYTWESIIDSKVSHMFRRIYERLYGIVQKYRKSE